MNLSIYAEIYIYIGKGRLKFQTSFRFWQTLLVEVSPHLFLRVRLHFLFS